MSAFMMSNKTFSMLSELESVKVPPFGLPIEREMYGTGGLVKDYI